jgi:hypothetical protein
MILDLLEFRILDHKWSHAQFLNTEFDNGTKCEKELISSVYITKNAISTKWEANHFVNSLNKFGPRYSQYGSLLEMSPGNMAFISVPYYKY